MMGTTDKRWGRRGDERGTSGTSYGPLWTQRDVKQAGDVAHGLPKPPLGKKHYTRMDKLLEMSIGTEVLFWLFCSRMSLVRKRLIGFSAGHICNFSFSM